MTPFVSLLWAGSLFALASAQGGGQYCDERERCFASFSNENGITFGFAIPETSEAPFDLILQVTAPKEVGWVGLSLGGTMTNAPLAVTWPNGDGVMISSRMAFSYNLPPLYENATYTLLEGSYTNDTHFVTTALCQGCSAWDPTGSNAKELDPSAENFFAYVYSSEPVKDPSNVDTTFNQHDSVGDWRQDLSSAQSADFDDWADDKLPGGGDPPATTTSEPPTSTTSPPESTVTGELPLPTGCGLESAFPLADADGWTHVKVAGSLSAPRGMVVDTLGNLLVIESGKGATVHSFGSDGCITSSKLLVDNKQLNHGITLTPDGKTLVVSSTTTAWRYSYDAAAQSVGDEEVVVQGMHVGGHSTRTTVIPPDTPNLLIVSHGSDGNIDLPTFDKEVGRALVKVFDLSKVPSGGYDYVSQGNFLGYGLRNEVAIVVDKNNMIWGVENSGDEFAREVDGESYDIHETNPAEELNYLGDPSKPNEDWYGYPTCFTVWDGSIFPDGDPATGSQFIPAPNDTWSDATCESKSTAPRLTFEAHAAPLDGKFDQDGSNMYVTLHGSWNRDTPAGYKVVQIPFTTNGDGGFEPVASQDSDDGYSDVLWDTQEGCNSGTCFRPSGLVWDAYFSRMFVASDNSNEGEIYLLAKSG